MNINVKKYTLILLIFVLSINNALARSRYFSDGDEVKKRPKLLILNFSNLHPAKKHNEYANKLPDDLETMFSSDQVESSYIKNLPDYKLSDLKNKGVLNRIRTMCRVYKKGLALIGEYKIVQEINKFFKTIIVNVVVYDAKLNLILFKQKFTGFLGLGYYKFIEKITSSIEKRLLLFKNDMDTVVRAIQQKKKNPLEKKGVISTGKGSHSADPAYIPDKGNLVISIIPNYTFHDIDFSMSPMEVLTLSAKLDFKYAITERFMAGINIGYIYYNKRDSSTQNDFSLKNRVINPVFSIKYKFFDMDSDNFNFSIQLDFQPNFSQKTYSTTSYLLRFPEIYGTYSIQFAFSGIYKNILAYFSLKISYINFNETYDYEDDMQLEYIKPKDNITLINEFYFGIITALSPVFSFDVRVLFRLQQAAESTIKYKAFATEQDEKLSTDPGMSFLGGIYFKPDNNTNIGLNFRYYLPYGVNTGGGGNNEMALQYELNLIFSFILKP